jgi:hypothetical protein
MLRRLLPALAVLALACDPQSATITAQEPTDDSFTVDEAPLLGTSGRDAAERGCNLVLRTLSRTRGPTGGFTTRCTAGRCVVVWTGALDVSLAALAEGARPYVLFKASTATAWTKVTPARIAGAPPGFQRYSVKLDKATLEEGLSASAWASASLEVAPYLLATTGARLFDKNRGGGDFDNYALRAGNGFAVAPDEGVCAPVVKPMAQLEFAAGWRTTQQGALVAGGQATLRYDAQRLTDCRGTHNGFPAWDIEASVRFLPGGEVVTGMLRARPFTFDVPPGATRAEVWFRNFTGAGSSCEAWDSNQGQNYAFSVEPRAPAKVAWVGNLGSSFARDCARRDGVPSPAVLDGYVRERACSFLDVDVYVPGLTDGEAALKPWAIAAQAQLGLDGIAIAPAWLTFVGRFGNDYRYRFELPRDTLYYGVKWSSFSATLRFSTDGNGWVSAPAVQISRDATWCNPAWGSCAP